MQVEGKQGVVTELKDALFKVFAFVVINKVFGADDAIFQDGRLANGTRYVSFSFSRHGRYHKVHMSGAFGDGNKHYKI